MSCTSAARAAAMIFSALALGSKLAMFSATVPADSSTTEADVVQHLQSSRQSAPPRAT